MHFPSLLTINARIQEFRLVTLNSHSLHTLARRSHVTGASATSPSTGTSCSTGRTWATAWGRASRTSTCLQDAYRTSWRNQSCLCWWRMVGSVTYLLSLFLCFFFLNHLIYLFFKENDKSFPTISEPIRNQLLGLTCWFLTLWKLKISRPYI